MPSLEFLSSTNNIDLSNISIDNIKINDCRIPLQGKDHMASEERIPQIAMLSKADLKRIIRQDQIEETYLMTIKVAMDPERKDKGSDEQGSQSTTEPGWIDKEYGSIFMEDLPAEMPPKQAVDHQIPLLPEMPPPFKDIFQLSQMELNELLVEGKISPSTSPYGAPVLFGKENDGSLQIYIDYHELNSQIVKNYYALPSIDELLDRVAGKMSGN
jgi:hypothetical protein